jgi:hypothetical protein
VVDGLYDDQHFPCFIFSVQLLRQERATRFDDEQPVNFGQTTIGASSVQRNITKGIFDTVDSLVLLSPEVCLSLHIQASFNVSSTDIFAHQQIFCCRPNSAALCIHESTHLALEPLS